MKKKGRLVMSLKREYFEKYVCENPSDLGFKVAMFLDRLVGFHRIRPDLHCKVEWENDFYIVVPFPQHFQLHTWDFNLLTKLVVLAHDEMLRVEVNPRHYRWLELVFHQRKSRDGSTMERMPTIEEHIKIIRGG